MTNDKSETLHPRLRNMQQPALIVGVVGLIICGAGFFINREQFYQSYLFGYLFWIHIALGCLGLLMLHHVVKGDWGFVIRRFMEAGAMTLPLLALLFIPILAGIPWLYQWARPEEVLKDELLQHKAVYLNYWFFTGRAVLYFVIWGGLAYLLNRWSLQQDKTGDPGLSGRMKTLSPPGLILFMLTISFAAFDWMMSLEPTWFSSIYGVLFLAGQALVTIALAIVLVTLTADREPLSDKISPALYSDLGNFLLAFVAFWAYISFSQYLIIWSANLPEEITWYIKRTQGGWQWLAMALIFFHFGLPFVLLLSRQVKRQAQILTIIAAFVILMRLVDLFWLVVPAFYPQAIHIHWLDLATLLGLGGFWLWFFIRQLKGKALLPLVG